MDGHKGNGFPWRSLAITWAVLVPAYNALAQAQATDSSSSELTATIRHIDAAAEIVKVAIGKSVLIDLSRPIVRASIASEEVASVVVLSPTQLMVTGKSYGATQLVVWTADEERKIFDILVQIEIPQLRAAIERSAPRADLDIQVVQSTVVLMGSVPDSDTADRIVQIAKIFSGNVVNHLRVKGEQQVLLRCTVAEVSKEALRSLGVNGFLAGKNFQDAFFLSNVGGVNPTSIGPVLESGPFNVTQPIPFMLPRAGVGVATAPTFSVGFPRIQMQLFVRALRQNGVLRVLAEPNLVAISGQTASFLAGGEFPVPVPQDQNTITIEYREFGVRLNFTPTVLGKNLIRLRVAPEVSELDFSTAVQFAGFTIPGLTERRAETTVELAAGQTMAMAGLLSEEVRGTAQKIPGIGDLPVLGALFSSVEYSAQTTELVILVTPEVIAGLYPDQVPPIPGEHDRHPNDWELFFLGQLEGEPAPPASSPTQALKTEFPTRLGPSSSSADLGFRGPWGQGAAPAASE